MSRAASRLVSRTADADTGEVDFETLLRGDDLTEHDVVPRSGPSRGLWLPMMSVAVGVAVVAGAVLALLLTPTSPAESGLPPADAVLDETAAPAAPAPRPDEPPAGASSRPQAITVSGRADRSWVARIAESTRIPPRALAAYAGAALIAAEESPACGLGWNTLAGIGLVESEHGTIHGSVLGEDGTASPAIIGIPLDGTASLVVRDSDGGALDGDAVWDRAVGPMQFIPETWNQWGADGDGDGSVDPQNIDDSALAAARYLCAAGGDLTDPDGWIAAVHAYNPSVEYNNRVADAAAHYAGSE